ncbi:MAG: hypothetical protein CVV46_07150 [Spirochaetae bacterium HGW-Spirochaetae-2]|jgi:dienelactone hydrolase|nr:MAG: hypothetical protein CVV46_07150 [Spirochaetae bacterium HGW-Spirochaetae-2]
MIALVVLFVLVAVEVIFLVIERTRAVSVRRSLRLTWLLLGAVFLAAMVSQLLDWRSNWMGIACILSVQSVYSLVVLLGRAKEHQVMPKRRKVGMLVLRLFLYLVLVAPLFLFPGSRHMQVTGSYAVGTQAYTWTDESRDETFTDEADHRTVTVQFWYPEDGERPYPLVVFSHGAFGYRMSNHSTFMELASNGYVVCSIDHPFHSFMTRQVDGDRVIVDMDFLQTAMAVEHGKIEGRRLYELEQSWMALRTADMNFVLDTILEKVHTASAEGVFTRIADDSIGVMGHSMGGATAAAIGRERSEVDAVVVLDGTMMGETIGYSDGVEQFELQMYPKTILNVFNEDHAKQAKALGDSYSNTYMHNRSDLSYQTVVLGSGHLNFTDLPLVSPVLANLLGTGTVDAEYCMRLTNSLVLEFFDQTLKGKGLAVARERIF